VVTPVSGAAGGIAGRPLRPDEVRVKIAEGTHDLAHLRWRAIAGQFSPRRSSGSPLLSNSAGTASTLR
jgi:hypothetical protein